MLGYHPFKAVAACALIAIGMPAQAQAPSDPSCSEGVTLPPELAGWAAPEKAELASNSTAAAAASVKVGQAVDAGLKPHPELRYVSTPGKVGGADSFGGLAGLVITAPGLYRVALGSAAWIDIVGKGAPIASSAHGHGPACSGIRKIVDFKLEPGRYTLQLANAAAPRIAVMVVRVP